MYENIKRQKHTNMQIYMQKNINVKNVKGYVKKLNIYIYIYIYIHIHIYKTTK